jgi:transcriptional regulator with XRE-family HTH domain
MLSVMHRTAVGLRIEQRLTEMDRDQRWLAMRLDRSASTIARWLDGSRRLAVEDLERIALVLHRPSGWLLGAEDQASDDESVEPDTLVRA